MSDSNVQAASHTDRERSPVIVLMIAISIAGAVLAGLYARANLATDDDQRVPLTVETKMIERSQDLTVDHWFSGRVEPRQRLQLASELAGKVESIRVDEGDAVKTGDVLLVLDTSLLLAERKQLRAAALGIKAEEDLAKRRLKRQKDLEAQGFSATDTIDEIETSLKLFASRRADILAQLERIAIQLEKSTVRAPFDANIQQRFTDVGAVINPGTTLLELLEAGVAEIKVGIPVDVARAVVAGDSRRVLVNGTTSNATVLSVAPAVDIVTQTVPVRLELQGNDFRFGEYANLHFETQASNAGFWIPNGALVEDERGMWSVFAVNQEDKITRYTASIVYADNRQAFVDINNVESLDVVVSGLNRISPGMLVSH